MLTEEKKKMAEECEWIIGFTMKQYNLDEQANEDWYGILAESYLHALEKFDPSKGIKFTSYANICMRREIKRQQSQVYQKDVRKIHCPEMKLLTSIDESPANTDGDVTIGDIIPSKETPFEDRLACSDSVLRIFSKIWGKLNETQKKYLSILYGNVLEYTDFNQKEIGKLLGISQQSVWFLKNSIRDLLKEEGCTTYENGI